jgi:hypothetical protein
MMVRWVCSREVTYGLGRSRPALQKLQKLAELLLFSACSIRGLVSEVVFDGDVGDHEEGDV